MFSQPKSRNFPVTSGAPRASKFEPSELPEENPEEFAAESHGEGDEKEPHEKIKKVVEEHGPAEEAKVVKHGAEKHSIHTTHESGHKHSSHDHDTQSMHEHLDHAFGRGSEKKEAKDNEPGAESMQHTSMMPEMGA